MFAALVTCSLIAFWVGAGLGGLVEQNDEAAKLIMGIVFFYVFWTGGPEEWIREWRRHLCNPRAVASCEP